MDTVGDAGCWRAVTVPLLAGGALLHHSRGLPPLPLLSRAHSLAPLPSSGSGGWRSVHLIWIHWLVSTKISSSFAPLRHTHTHPHTNTHTQLRSSLFRDLVRLCLQHPSCCYSIRCCDPLTFPRWSPDTLWVAVMCMTALKALLLRVCAYTKAGVGLIMLKNSAVVQFSLNCPYTCVCVCVCVEYNDNPSDWASLTPPPHISPMSLWEMETQKRKQ